ncbi:hypothetical protein BMR04_15865, partial [Methylococcaceae bacterium HT3]
MMIELFQQALHINAPWLIKSVDFNADKKRLDIYIDFKKGSTFVDPDATADSSKEYKAYDTVQKTWCYRRSISAYNWRILFLKKERHKNHL